MLDDWHDFDLAQVEEQLIVLFLVRAVQDEIGTEDEDASCEDRKDL